jgi:hypothetical protein
MDNLNSDILPNDTEEKTAVWVPLNSRREFLCAAAATSGGAILSAEFLPETARASTDKVAELVLPPATKAVTPFEVHVPEAALDDLKRRLAETRWPNKRTYPKLFYWNEVPKGGHFAAFEQPELFVAELRKSFAQLR